MHEMGLAQSILEIALEAARGEKVRRIDLQIGKAQMVKPESLEFSFRFAADGTAAAGAGFAITELPLVLRCAQCSAESEADLPPWNCRQCGSSETEILSGDEFQVEAVELESGRVVRRQTSAAHS